MDMKRSFLLCTAALSLAFAWGCNSLVEKKPSEVSDRKTRTLPLSISFVPAWSGPSGRGISMATNTLDTFYVIVRTSLTMSKRHSELQIVGGTTRYHLN